MTTIREKGYAHWDGEFIDRRFPWWPITRTSIKLAFQRKHFKFFFSGAFIPAVVFLVGIYISERIEDFRFMFKGSDKLLVINPAYFKTYMTGDFLLFMIVMLLTFSGAGLISDDIKHNSLQLYFSRPIRKMDYFLGKASVIFFFTLVLTLVPGLIFFFMKLVFSGNFDFFLAYPWLPLAVFAYAGLLTVFLAFYTLLISALSKNRRYVSIMMFTIYIFSESIHGILFGIFRNPYLALFSIKANIQQAGAAIFGQKLPYAFPQYLSFLVLGAVCLLSAYVLKRRIRGVEVIR